MPFVMNGDVRIRYEVEGSGTPLVLAHGATVGLEMWEELGYTEALRGEHQLILIDARGHGQSDKPHDPAAYRPDLMARDVLVVLDELGVAQAHYLGASLGAAIGFEIGRRALDTLRSLVLLGYGRCGPPSEAEQQFARAGLALFQLGVALGGEAVLAAIETPGNPQTPVFRAAYRTNDWAALLAMQTAYLEWPGLDGVLPQISVPCLLLAAEGDPFYPSAQECAKVLPRATFIPLPAGVHGQASYGSERVLPHLRPFLAGIDGPSRDRPGTQAS